MDDLPRIDNRVKEAYIDATPGGYALRILQHYLAKAHELWVIEGDIAGCELFEAMNEHQRMRQEELSEAIRILKQHYE